MIDAYIGNKFRTERKIPSPADSDWLNVPDRH